MDSVKSIIIGHKSRGTVPLTCLIPCLAAIRTQEQHDIHLTAKLVLFEFVNTFLALFYVGFYLQDLRALRQET